LLYKVPAVTDCSTDVDVTNVAGWRKLESRWDPEKRREWAGVFEASERVRGGEN
jgi:hypothetical protein